MDSAKQSPSSTAKPLARVAVHVKPEHRVRAATLRPTPSRASSEPPTTIFEERPTIPMWGLTGANPARPPADAKVELFPPPAVVSAPVAPAAVEPAPAPAKKTPRPAAKLESPAFGAGMLQARKVRTKDPMATQRVRAVADGPMFGANVLRSRTSAGKWVALALAVAAIAAVIVAAI
jgi:hypothetical protein